MEGPSRNHGLPLKGYFLTVCPTGGVPSGIYTNCSWCPEADSNTHATYFALGFLDAMSHKSATFLDECRGCCFCFTLWGVGFIVSLCDLSFPFPMLIYQDSDSETATLETKTPKRMSNKICNSLILGMTPKILNPKS